MKWTSQYIWSLHDQYKPFTLRTAQDLTLDNFNFFAVFASSLLNTTGSKHYIKQISKWQTTFLSPE